MPRMPSVLAHVQDFRYAKTEKRYSAGMKDSENFEFHLARRVCPEIEGLS